MLNVYNTDYKAQSRLHKGCLPNITPYGQATLVQQGRRGECWRGMNNKCCVLNSVITLKPFVFPTTNGNKQHKIVGFSKFIFCFTWRNMKSHVQY